MPEKLFTIKELSGYLNIPEEKIERMVEIGDIPAYVIGGSFLRFRKEQIDLMKDEILAKLKENSQASAAKAVYEIKETAAVRDTFLDRIKDFIYFNDFYILCAIVIGLLLYIIINL